MTMSDEVRWHYQDRINILTRFACHKTSVEAVQKFFAFGDAIPDFNTGGHITLRMNNRLYCNWPCRRRVRGYHAHATFYKEDKIELFLADIDRDENWPVYYHCLATAEEAAACIVENDRWLRLFTVPEQW